MEDHAHKIELADRTLTDKWKVKKKKKVLIKKKNQSLHNHQIGLFYYLFINLFIYY